MARAIDKKAATTRNFAAISKMAKEFKEYSITVENHEPVLLHQDEWMVDESPNGKKSKYISFENFNAFMSDGVDSDECDTLVCFIEKGYYMDFHNHKSDGYEVESCLVINGYVKYRFEDGRTISIIGGESYTFNAREDHSFEVLKDSKIIVSFKPRQV